VSRRWPTLLSLALVVGACAGKKLVRPGAVGPDAFAPVNAPCPSGRKPAGSGACIADLGTRCKLDGLAFSPFMQGQSPLAGTIVPADQVRARLELVADATQRIRTYGVRSGLESTCRMARELGLGFDQGIWLGKDAVENRKELAAFTDLARTCRMDSVIVGNEAAWRKDLTVAELLAFIAQVRAVAPAGTRITTAEVWKTWIDHPDLVDSVDVIYMHADPYWDGHPIDGAMSQLSESWSKVVQASRGRPVEVAETGWPSLPGTRGPAASSPETAARYLTEFVAWAEERGVRYHYFESFDEDWKAGTEEGAPGASWGILTRDGVPKPGLTALLSAGTRTCPSR